MERNISTSAIVIDSLSLAKGDLLLTLLSREFGVIRVMNWGGRKSGKGIKVPLCADGTFYLYLNPVKMQYTLKDVKVSAMHDTLRDDLYRNYISLFFCEVVRVTFGGESESCYHLLSPALAYLENPLFDPTLVLIQFLWHLMEILGVRDALDECPHCGREYEDSQVLGFSSMVVAPCCLECATVKEGMLLPPGSRRYLKMTASMAFGQSVSVELNPRTKTRIKRYLIKVVSLICDKPLKTLQGDLILNMD